MSAATPGSYVWVHIRQGERFPASMIAPGHPHGNRTYVHLNGTGATYRQAFPIGPRPPRPRYRESAARRGPLVDPDFRLCSLSLGCADLGGQPQSRAPQDVVLGHLHLREPEQLQHHQQDLHAGDDRRRAGWVESPSLLPLLESHSGQSP